MNILEKTYFKAYLEAVGSQIESLILKYDFSKNKSDFEFLTKSSAVFSSNIEGNTIDLNSFMNYELNKDKFKPGKEIEEIENLINAYSFAQQNPLTEKNLLQSHKIFSETLLIKSKRGKYRNGPIGVFGKTGLIYLALEPENVESEMGRLFRDIEMILKSRITVLEAFYFASMIHLRFAHIHPFRDGNGRAARLLEKWFLAEKLGREYWKLESERYYKEHLSDYYSNINLGVNFYELDYTKSIGFLKLLIESMKD